MRVNRLVRPYWEKADEIYIIKTKNGETIDGIIVPKINFGKPPVYKGIAYDESRKIRPHIEESTSGFAPKGMENLSPHRNYIPVENSNFDLSGANGKLFNSHDDFDIYCDRQNDIVYIFHGLDISHLPITYIEYHVEEHWAVFVLDDGTKLDLGARIQWLVRPYWEKADEISIIRTKNGETIDGFYIRKINIGRQAIPQSLKRQSTTPFFSRFLNFFRGCTS